MSNAFPKTATRANPVEIYAFAARSIDEIKSGLPNIEYHLATIEKLPLPNSSVDCVISNCVINLAPDKPAVFHEIARVLKSGGRLAVSDIALKRDLPPEIGNDVMAYIGCIAGAILIEDYRKILGEAGIAHIEVIDSGRDLNAYAKVENQAGCCSPLPAVAILPITEVGCCSTTGETFDPLGADFHTRLTELLRRYNVNDSAASVRVFAVKP